MYKQVHCNVETSFVTNSYTMQKRPSDSLWPEFGRWLKKHREDLHFSQSGAAQRAGIDRQQWYRIENGLSGTKRDTVIAIAKALSLPVGEALKRAGFGSTTDTEAGLFSGLEKLTPEKQKLAKRQIKAIIESINNFTIL